MAALRVWELKHGIHDCYDSMFRLRELLLALVTFYATCGAVILRLIPCLKTNY